MIPKKNRLNKAIFQEVFKKSKIFHGSYISLRINYGNYQISRFSVVVPKVVVPKAVHRNALKRKIYDSLDLKAIKKPYIGIFTLKKEAKNINPEKIKEDALKLITLYGSN